MSEGLLKVSMNLNDILTQHISEISAHNLMLEQRIAEYEHLVNMEGGSAIEKLIELANDPVSGKSPRNYTVERLEGERKAYVRILCMQLDPWLVKKLESELLRVSELIKECEYGIQT